MSTDEPLAPGTSSAADSGAGRRVDAGQEPGSSGAGVERTEPAALGSTQPEMLDVDGVGAVTAGTIAFAVAFLGCLALRAPLADSGRSWWTWVCATGTILGLAGLVFVRRRRTAYADHAAHDR